MSTKLELPDPVAEAPSVRWPLRATDIDPHGHLNNAIYWQAVEHALAVGVFDLARPLVAEPTTARRSTQATSSISSPQRMSAR